MACSTCHVVFSPDWEHFNTLPPKSDDELDMLDMVPILEPTLFIYLFIHFHFRSRLGCQIKVNELFEGQEITIPKI